MRTIARSIIRRRHWFRAGQYWGLRGERVEADEELVVTRDRGRASHWERVRWERVVELHAAVYHHRFFFYVYGFEERTICLEFDQKKIQHWMAVI